MRTRLTRIILGAALIALTAGGLTVAAPTAEAGVRRCDSNASLYIGDGTYTFQPSTFVSQGPTGNCELWYGTTGYGVQALQMAINRCYYPSRLKVDGHFGPATLQALIDVQHRIGVRADGNFGPTTRGYMAFEVTAGGSGCTSRIKRA